MCFPKKTKSVHPALFVLCTISTCDAHVLLNGTHTSPGYKRMQLCLLCSGPAPSLGGGVFAVRNLPQFTAILPQFFSDASIQKFYFSPQENSFPPFAVTRHNVRVCVLICPACHLCGRTLVCLCVPKMSSTSGDSDSGNGKRPVKCGKGQRGPKARYATQISPAAHVHIVRDMESASSTVLCIKSSKMHSWPTMMVAWKDGWISCLC